MLSANQGDLLHSDKGMEGFGMLARNLLGSWNSLGIRSENGLDQSRAELPTAGGRHSHVSV